MLNFRKIISLLMCFLVLSPAIGFNMERSLADERTDALNENVNIAVALGILNKDAADRCGEQMTRGEFFDAISRLLGAGSLTDISPFTDLQPSHPHYSGICSAYSLGIISGYGDGTVRPDEFIQQNAAVRLLAYAIGWKDAISGGMKVEQAAVHSDICSYGDATSAQELTVGTGAGLLVNTGLAYAVELGGIGSVDDYVYSSKTLFEKYLNVFMLEGIVTGNGASGLNSGYSEAGEGRVLIDGRMFFDNAAAGNLLGMYVTAYCTTKNAQKPNTVIYACADENANNVLVIHADDEPVYRNGVLSYTDDDDSEETVRLSISSCDFLYNGKNVPADESLMSPASGTITIIDNDADGEYDVVSIEERKTYIVENVNVLEEKIITKTGEIFDLKEAQYFGLTEQSGVPAYLVELGEWDVLAVCESKDKSVLKICVADKVIIGTLDSCSLSGNPTVEVDGICYELSDYAIARQGGQFSSSLSKRAIFRFDVDGKIACADFDSFAKDKYGYIIAWSSSVGIDTSVKVKILSDTGDIEICDVAEKLILDGGRITLSAISGYLRDNNPESFSAEKPQLVVYQKNESGKLTLIDTAYTTNLSGAIGGNAIGDGESPERSLHLFYDCYTMENGLPTENTTQSELRYTARGNKFVQEGTLNTTNSRMTVAKTYGLVLPFDEGTKVFVVPYDVSGDDELYRVMSMGEVAQDSESNFFCRAFKRLSDNPVAEALLVLESDPKEVNSKSAPVVVAGTVRSALTADGEQVNLFDAYTESGLLTYTTKDTSVLGAMTLLPGDVIRVKTNASGVVTGCEKVYERNASAIVDYDPTDDTDDPYCNTWTIRSAYRIRLANVYRVMGGYFISTTEQLAANGTYTPDWRYETRPLSDYMILVYDSEKDLVRTGTTADLTGFVNTGGSQWSKIFTYDRTGTGKIMVIYK